MDKVKNIAKKINDLYGPSAAADFMIHYTSHVDDEVFMNKLFERYKNLKDKA